MARSGKFIVIGTFNENLQQDNKKPQNPGDLNARVEEIAMNLISKGY